MTSARSDKEPPPVHGESGGEPSDGEKHRDDGDALSRVHGVVLEVELHGTCARLHRDSDQVEVDADGVARLSDIQLTSRYISYPLRGAYSPRAPEWRRAYARRQGL